MDSNVVTPPQEGPLPKEAVYYRNGFRVMMRLANVQAAIILVMICVFAFYVNTKENHDRFFAETGEGRIIEIDALDLPNMGKMAIGNWVSLAAGQIMTFGFNDIDERFALSQKNFTPQGWESFRKAILKSELIDKVLEAQQIITTVPAAPPVLAQEGIVNGNYSWTFDMPLLITFRSGGVKTSRSLSVRMVVEMIPTPENPNGIGISEWYLN